MRESLFKKKQLNITVITFETVYFIIKNSYITISSPIAKISKPISRRCFRFLLKRLRVGSRCIFRSTEHTNQTLSRIENKALKHNRLYTNLLVNAFGLMYFPTPDCLYAFNLEAGADAFASFNFLASSSRAADLSATNY